MAQRRELTMSTRHQSWTLGLLLLGGCSYGVGEITDQTVCDMAATVRDPEPGLPVRTPSMPPANGKNLGSGPDIDKEESDELIHAAASTQADKAPPPGAPSLVVPDDLPGSKADPIKWPDTKPEKEEALKKLYPTLPPLPADLHPAPGPDGKSYTLSDLQRLATGHSPAIKSAAAAVEAARGAVEQAGAYPNPTGGYQGDTIGNAATAGFQGFFFDQIIKTGNKLKLQQAAATMDLLNAELALRKAQADLSSQVRQGYFQVLVAQENIKVSKALVKFTDAIYRVQIDLLDKGFSAPYEPMQLRPLVLQSRFNLLQARNQYQTAWKQLAATMGLPGMPASDLAGRLNVAIPDFEYDEVLTQVLRQHTTVLAAQNDIQKARYNLQLARITPLSDVEARVAIQKDFTAAPFLIVHSAQVGVTLPIWDQNRGNIRQAEGVLVQAYEEPHQVRAQLTSGLADAYGRYDTARRSVEIAQQQIDDQVRVYRNLYDRRNKLNDVSFGDLVTAEQTLAGYVGNYITALGQQWTAVVDVAGFLQTDDLFASGKKHKVAPVFDLDDLPPLPCTHPCVPLPDEKYLHGVDGQWLGADADKKTKPMPPPDKQTRKTQPDHPDVTPNTRRPAPLRQSPPSSNWASDRAPAIQADDLQEPPPFAPKGKQSK
jgi:outer membrane protein, heavy metal efflux system